MTSPLGGRLRRALAPPPLRPPGALADAPFHARCIRCGRCAAACPYRAIRPGGALDAGAPAVVPRVQACLLCMRCPPACPTGALAPVTDPRAVRMGRARVDPRACYAHLGILCRTCVDECPFPEGEAIAQDERLRPVVTDRCVGCGLCEARCPAPDVAIRVVPAEALR